MSPEFTEHAAALADLCRRYGVQRLELFGSAAAGQDDPAWSDLDFLVEFEPLAYGTYADAYFGVLEGLEAMFRRPVDLVVDSAIRNRYFRELVDQTKTLLYAAWNKKYLLDVQQAAALASESVAGRTFADYQATAMLRAAVERQCEIIGEALAKLAKADDPVATRISEYRRIIAFRNHLSLLKGRSITVCGGTVTSFGDLVRELPADAVASPRRNELATIKLRYKAPDGDTSQLISVVLRNEARPLSANLGFASAVAEFGMLLRQSKHAGTGTFESAVADARRFRGEAPEGNRAEFVKLVELAASLRRMHTTQ